MAGIVAAAVAVENMRFGQEIENLMISITQVFTDAIDTRIPYNYYHSRNVYLYVRLLVDYINRQHEAGKTDREEKLFSECQGKSGGDQQKASPYG